MERLPGQTVEREELVLYDPVKNIIERISEGFAGQKVEKSKESDFDFLVDLEDKVDLFQFISIKLNLEKLLHSKVDLISSNGLSPYISPYIEREKTGVGNKK